MQVLFASGLPRNVLSQFKRWPINAVTGSQRCRQHEPGHEGWASSVLELFREDVRCVGPEVWPEEFSHLRVRQLGEVLRDFRFSIPPGKIVVRLGKTQFCQPQHHFWSSKGLSKKNNVWVLSPDVFDEPLPKGKGFRVWIVDPKDPHALLDPVHNDALQLLPQFAPSVALELKRKNILILFRWVFRILHGPIRPDAKPLSMLLHIGMIRRTLKRDVQRNLDAIGACSLQQSSEVVQCPQIGMNRLMASIQRPDRPRTPWIRWAASRRIVLSLPMRVSDRMDGREIQHVKSH